MDPFRGLDDLRAGILRHTTERFADDPVRVLRVMQLAARFDFEVARETIDLCRTLVPGTFEMQPDRLFLSRGQRGAGVQAQRADEGQNGLQARHPEFLRASRSRWTLAWSR